MSVDYDTPIGVKTPEENAPAKGDKGKKPSKTMRLILEAKQDCNLFIADGHAYAVVKDGDKTDTLPVKSASFRGWLMTLAIKKIRDSIGDNAARDAAANLDAAAHREGKTGAVHRRLARIDDTIYLDLCDRERRVVKVTADDWTVGAADDVHFIRHDNMASLPVPESGGAVDDLWRFINVCEDDRPLFRAFLLDCLKGDGPYLILLINGEQGSAKSTATKLIRCLVDPVHKAAARRLQRDEYELAIAAQLNAVLCFDNVSTLPQWLSDALASLATGSGFGVRTLYSQDEETVYGAARPICFNGIPDFAESPDLLDRAVKVTLPTIADADRKTDDEISAAFNHVQPKLLGALLDMVVVGLKNYKNTRLTSLPRMASSAKWVAACETDLPTDAARFAERYAANRADLASLALDNSPLAQALLCWIDAIGSDTWEGTASRLLMLLVDGQFVPKAYVAGPRFPKDAARLSSELNRLAPELRKIGVDVTKVGGSHKKGRLVRIDASRYRAERGRPAVRIIPAIDDADVITAALSDDPPAAASA